MTAMSKFRPDGYDNALLCLVVSFVRYHEPLPGLHTAGRRNQSTSAVDDDRVGFLIKWSSTRCMAVNEERNMDMNASRPTALRVTERRYTGSFSVLWLSAQQFGPFQGFEDLTHGRHTLAQATLFPAGRVNGLLSLRTEFGNAPTSPGRCIPYQDVNYGLTLGASQR